MKTLISIKKDLEFDKGLASLLEVLKTIAVSQYRLLEQKLKAYSEFSEAVSGFFDFVNLRDVDHPFVNPREKEQIVVAVTSDSGLLGGLNMQVIGAAFRELDTMPGKLIVIGERGKRYAKEGRFPFVAFGGIKDEERMAQALQLRDYIMERLLKESIGCLKVVYPRPISFTVQRVEIQPFLPFQFSDKPSLQAAEVKDVILESRLSDILEYLVFLWTGQRLFEIFGLSRLSEFAARFVHLEESTQKLKEMDAKLQLQYFRVRHELIDRNMRELFSARLLYASKHK